MELINPCEVEAHPVFVGIDYFLKSGDENGMEPFLYILALLQLVVVKRTGLQMLPQIGYN